MANDLQLFTGDDDEKLPVAPGLGAMPALVLSAGEHGTYRFLEFFAAHIRNPEHPSRLLSGRVRVFPVVPTAQDSRVVGDPLASCGRLRGAARKDPCAPIGQAALGRDPDAV